MGSISNFNIYNLMKKKLAELVRRIDHDLKLATDRRNEFEKGSEGYIFNHSQIIALKTVLFDLKELRLTDED